MTRGEKIQAVILLFAGLLLMFGIVAVNRARKVAVARVRQLEEQLVRSEELYLEAETLKETVQGIGSLIDRWRELGEELDAP